MLTSPGDMFCFSNNVSPMVLKSNIENQKCQNLKNDEIYEPKGKSHVVQT